MESLEWWLARKRIEWPVQLLSLYLLNFTHLENIRPIHCKFTKPPVYPHQGVLCLTMSRTCTGREHCVLCACVWMLYVLTQFLHICIHEWSRRWTITTGEVTWPLSHTHTKVLYLPFPHTNVTSTSCHTYTNSLYLPFPRTNVLFDPYHPSHNKSPYDPRLD